ncbi:glycosyltransferase [Janibacter sp. RAF20_2_2]
MRASTRQWLRAHSHVHTDFDATTLVEHLRAKGETVTVVIPARDESATVGDVVTGLRRELVEQVPLVSELVVVDSDSTDDTAAVAADAGATVHRAADIAPHLGAHPGKGEALWKSLFVTSADLLVFVDADLTQWGPHFVTGLVGTLTADPRTQLVKGWYDRVMDVPGRAPSTEGGRVTELVARPVIDLWWPLLDTHTRHGLDAIAQVDLGCRAHRHQRDHDLAVMAAELLVVVHARRHGEPVDVTVASETLEQFTREGGWRTRALPLRQRPPAATQPGYPAGAR